MKKSILFLAAMLTGITPVMSAGSPDSGAARVCKPPKVSMPGETTRIPGMEEHPVLSEGFARPLNIPVKKLPRRLVRDGEMLMALSFYNNSGFTKGINRLDFSGNSEFLWADDYIYRRYVPTTGFVRDGRLCYFTKYQIFSIDDYRYLVADPYTGEILEDRKVLLYSEVTGFDNYLPLYTSIAYNTDEDVIYGYSANEAGSGYSFVKAPGADPVDQEIILDKVEYANVCASICYNEKEKALYGINRDNNFVKIDFDGTQTVVMPMGVRTMWSRAALMYVADEDYYLWNCQLTDGTTGLWCIDPSNNQVSTFVDFQSEGVLPIMFFGETAKDPRAISMPIMDVADFGFGQNDGTISYFIPSTRFDG
ncbi:MAG: hypothetical protein K2I37_06335, partial [Muribaculaceae bacterium]|nr:hypothetical protein [Muribaculaceae bacterium]